MSDDQKTSAKDAFFGLGMVLGFAASVMLFVTVVVLWARWLFF